MCKRRKIHIISTWTSECGDTGHSMREACKNKQFLLPCTRVWQGGCWWISAPFSSANFWAVKAMPALPEKSSLLRSAWNKKRFGILMAESLWRKKQKNPKLFKEQNRKDLWFQNINIFANTAELISAFLLWMICHQDVTLPTYVTIRSAHLVVFDGSQSGISLSKRKIYSKSFINNVT